MKTLFLENETVKIFNQDNMEVILTNKLPWSSVLDIKFNHRLGWQMNIQKCNGRMLNWLSWRNILLHKKWGLAIGIFGLPLFTFVHSSYHVTDWISHQTLVFCFRKPNPYHQSLFLPKDNGPSSISRQNYCNAYCASWYIF
jgi:hypothetical protein